MIRTSCIVKQISKIVYIFVIIGIMLIASTKIAKADNNKWQGVDEAVVEKYAKKYGVEPREPFINTDQGDLLLFIFALAGATGGFIIGYNFRKIFKEKSVDIISRT